VTASDADSGADGKISFAITSGNERGLFSINNEGNITVAGTLDRETTPNFYLSIEAQDSPRSGAPRSSNRVTLAVSLKDKNDNAPTFKTNQCIIYVSDDTPVSSKVTTIDAFDLDIGVNKQIDYSINAGTNSSYFNSYFTFASATSDIFVKKSLDLNLQNLTSKQLTFTITATDRGSLPLSSSMLCSLNIQGENKYSPHLSHESEIMVTITKNAPLGSAILKINATDADFGPNGLLTFTITSGNDDNVFAISTTGQISLAKTPTRGFYLVKVNVSDSGSRTKQKTTLFEMHAYYLGVELKAGQVFIGDKQTSPSQNIETGDELLIPVYIQVGLQKLEGFDVSIDYDPSILSVKQVQSPMAHAQITSGKIRLIGRVSLGDQAEVGVIKIADLNFVGKKTATKFSFLSVVESIHDQLGSHIPKSSTPTSQTCPQTTFGDATQDCKLTIADACFCQSYIRHKRSDGFSSDDTSKFASLSSKQKLVLDADKNKMITMDDCDYVFDVLMGNSIAFGEVYLRVPDHKDHQGSCMLSATVTTDTSVPSTITELDSVLLILTYSDSAFLRNEHTTSNSKVASFNTRTGVTSVHGDVIKMTQSRSAFQFETSITHLPTSLGITLAVISRNTVTGNTNVKTLFRKPSEFVTMVTVNVGDNNVFKFSPSYSAQQSVSMKDTTHRCQNPLKTISLQIAFDNDYKALVMGREDKFKAEFAVFFTDHERQNGREVSVSNVAVSEGSIIVSFDVEHLQSEQPRLLSDLILQIQDGTFSYVYNSTKLTPKKTLYVDGNERIVEKKDKDDTWIYIVIAIVASLVFILAITVICLVCSRSKKRSKVMISTTDLKNVIEAHEMSDYKRVKTDAHDEVEEIKIEGDMEIDVVALTPVETVSFCILDLLYEYNYSRIVNLEKV